MTYVTLARINNDDGGDSEVVHVDANIEEMGWHRNN
jgi:hypothetical protein